MNTERTKIIFLFLFLLQFPVAAQKHFVYLKDKNNSKYSLARPEEFLSEKSISRRQKQDIILDYKDLPVSTSYVEEIKSKGAKVLYRSRWLNAVLIEADGATLDKIKALDYVAGTPTSLRKESAPFKFNPSIDLGSSSKRVAENYGASADQAKMLGIDAMHQEGHHGEGITIAILDGGFNNADSLEVFSNLFKNNQIISTRNFTDSKKSVYDEHQHGMQVFSVVGGDLPGLIVGGAYKANYHLLVTEVTESESRLEEIYWLLGAEYADSAGVDILTSSLGYNTFNNHSENYSISQLDGETALITRAADLAARTGMLIIVSAGNEGDNSWGKVTFPADADSALAVGAVDRDGSYASFSSKGFTADKRVKPDVTAMGSSATVASVSGGITQNKGTSFSTPGVAGLAAGLWQAFPELTNMELIELIKKSATKYLNPDSLKGYGIPNFQRAKEIMTNGVAEGVGTQNTLIYPNPLSNSPLIIRDERLGENEKVKVAISNIAGQQLYADIFSSSSGSLILESKFLDRLPEGTYTVKISFKNNSITKKLIKN